MPLSQAVRLRPRPSSRLSASSVPSVTCCLRTRRGRLMSRFSLRYRRLSSCAMGHGHRKNEVGSRVECNRTVGEAKDKLQMHAPGYGAVKRPCDNRESQWDVTNWARAPLRRLRVAAKLTLLLPARF